MKIYLASSWRNEIQQKYVKLLREAGHQVYDFKHPTDTEELGFHWEDVDADFRSWTVKDYQKGLSHPVAERGFQRDWDAMLWADVCVLLLPCGRSAHAEAGWMKGAGKPVYVVMEELEVAELMYKLFDGVCDGPEELLRYMGTGPA